MELLSYLFSVPPLPPIDLPLAVRVIPGIHKTLTQAFELVYHRGLFDGFVAGILLTMLLAPRLTKRT